MKVLIAPDSFKGSLDAPGVAAAIKQGLVEGGLSPANIVTQPLADGGEGTAHTLGMALHMDYLEVEVSDPLGRPLRSGWYFHEEKSLAVMDMASASGLSLLAAAERNPLFASTYGTGQMMAHAMEKGARHLWIGLGGSATCDMGLGALTRLGLQMHDEQGIMLGHRPEDFLKAHRIMAMNKPAGIDITYLYDVDVPLLGPNNCLDRYAPQKGANQGDIDLLTKGFRQVSQCLKQMDRDVAHHPGGFGLRNLLGAQGKPGFKVVAGALRLEQSLAACNWVIGGEGQIDSQTLDGKVVHGLAALCQAHGKPLLLVCGSILNAHLVRENLSARYIHSIIESGISVEQSMADPETALREAGRAMAKYITENHDVS
jgi:glycerate kinase